MISLLGKGNIVFFRLMNGWHPLVYFVENYLSADSRLLPETIRQLRLLEITALLTAFGLILLIVFFKYWQTIPAKVIRCLLFFLIFIIAVLVRVVSAERGLESMILFDSVHYAVPAAELVEHGRLTLPLNQEDHPNSKSPGFSLLIAPFYLIFKNSLGAGVFSPFLLGIFSLLLIYRLARSVAGERTALLTLLLLAFSPLYTAYGRVIMPSIGSLFFILSGFLLLRKKKGWLRFGIAGFLFGFAAVIRYLTVAAIPAAVCSVIAQKDERLDVRIKKASFLILGALLPLAALFYYQWQEFGSPWLTGYSYWVHFHPNTERPFSFDYAFGIPPMSGGSPNSLFALISATGANIPSPNIWSQRPDQLGWALLIWLFALIGLFRLYRKDRSLFLFISLFFIGFYLPHAFLFTQAGHFMLPIVPYIILAASIGLGTILSKAPHTIRSFGKGVLLILLLSFLPTAYAFSHWPFEPARQEFLDFARWEIPEGSYLISDFEPILFTHQVGRPKEITFIGISSKVSYADRKLYWKGTILPPPLLAATENLEEIRLLLRKSSHVYLSAFQESEYLSDYQKMAEELNFQLIAQSKHFKLYKIEDRQ